MGAGKPKPLGTEVKVDRGSAREGVAMAARNPKRADEAGLQRDVTTSGSCHRQDRGVFGANTSPSHEAQR